MIKEISFEIATIFRIRLKQLYRTLFQIGLIRLLFVLVILSFVGITIYFSFKDTQKAYIISFCWLLIIAFIHSRRADYTFLLLNMNFPRLICSAEYLLFSIPIIVILSVNKQFTISLILLFCAFVIGLSNIRLNWQSKTLNTYFQNCISADMYEWKAGIRNNFPLIIISWILGLCISFFIASVPVAIFIIGLSMINFYDRNESWQILISFEKGARSLLMHKIKKHTIYFLILISPLVIAFNLFHFTYWYIPVIEVTLFLSIHIYSIVLKYTFYSHTREYGNTALLMIGTLIGLIPVTTPFLWIFSAFLFYKACQNLNNYLYDFN